MSKNFQKPFQPTTLGDFVFSNPNANDTLSSILNGTIPFPANKCGICFYGAYGSGKTALAKLMPDLLEASGKLPQFPRQTSGFGPYSWVHFSACGLAGNTVAFSQELAKRVNDQLLGAASGWHYEILDEIDLLTPAAQGSLKALADPGNGTIFLLTTNNIEKVDAGVRNRMHSIQMDLPDAVQLEQVGRKWMQSVGLTGNELTPADWADLIKSCSGFRDFGDTIATVCQVFKDPK